MKSLNLASQTYKELWHHFIRRLVPFVAIALLEKRWIRHKSLKLCSTRCLCFRLGGLSSSSFSSSSSSSSRFATLLYKYFRSPFFMASFRSAPSSALQIYRLLLCPQTWFVLIKAAQKCIFTALFFWVRFGFTMWWCRAPVLKDIRLI